MEKPISTGAKFGLGFALVFGLVSFALEYASLTVIDSLYPEATYGEPSVVRSEPVVRDGVFVVLATVSNTDDTPITFDAEATIFDTSGEFLDTCYVDRTYELAGESELSFVATCSIGPESGSESAVRIEGATLQFY